MRLWISIKRGGKRDRERSMSKFQDLITYPHVCLREKEEGKELRQVETRAREELIRLCQGEMSEQTRQCTRLPSSVLPPSPFKFWSPSSTPFLLLVLVPSFPSKKISLGSPSAPVRSIDSLAKCPCRIIFRRMEHKSWAAKLNFVFFLHYCSWAIELVWPTRKEVSPWVSLAKKRKRFQDERVPLAIRS